MTLFLQHAPSPTILCVGDIMLDLFVEGAVHRISPEAPIPILRETSRFHVVGGAGNVVRNLSSLGAKVSFLGAIDTHDVGIQIKNLLHDLPGVTSFLWTEPAWITPHKTRFVCQGQQLLRFDREQPCTLSTEGKQALLLEFSKRVSECDAVILSDYDKGLLACPELCQTMIQMARTAHTPILIDPKGHHYDKYKGSTLLTPNLSELKAVTKRTLLTHEDINNAACTVKKDHDITHMIITLSADGLMVMEKGSETGYHLPSHAKEVFDVSGAGDTVIATLAYTLACGASLKEAAHLANKAGGIVVGKTGTAVIERHELFFQDVSKVMTLENVLTMVTHWRRNNLSIGFTNGCFDLLHLGHLSLLKQAKSQCDRLIVGLNTDSSIHSLKGPSRPIQTEHVRAHVLAALEMVDAVVLFDEATPLTLIHHILPDVLIKGADYKVEDVVGGESVRAYGGRVYLATLEDGYSTTNTISRMNTPRVSARLSATTP